MEIKFLGTRGSIPVPGADTLKYGGNTTSIRFCSDEGITVIIDAGTGIRKLNKEKIEDEVFNLIFTHSHWDHLQGLPFLVHLYKPGRKFHFLIDELYLDDIRGSIIKQMSGKSFPVLFDYIPADLKFVPVKDVYHFTKTFRLELFYNEHPGGSSGLKFIDGEKVFTFITDNEIKTLKEKGRYEEFLQFCRGSNVIAHDGQYVEKDMKLKKGWGHSTIDDIIELYGEIEPDIGIFTHHDPERRDGEIDEIFSYAKEKLGEIQQKTRFIAAYEDMIIDF